MCIATQCTSRTLLTWRWWSASRLADHTVNMLTSLVKDPVSFASHFAEARADGEASRAMKPDVDVRQCLVTYRRVLNAVNEARVHAYGSEGEEAGQGTPRSRRREGRPPRSSQPPRQ
ncbi:hypothetical protein GCM10020295_43450 [Streptomyces cinereospinus]